MTPNEITYNIYHNYSHLGLKWHIFRDKLMLTGSPEALKEIEGKVINNYYPNKCKIISKKGNQYTQTNIYKFEEA